VATGPLVNEEFINGTSRRAKSCNISTVQIPSDFKNSSPFTAPLLWTVDDPLPAPELHALLTSYDFMQDGEGYIHRTGAAFLHCSALFADHSTITKVTWYHFFTFFE
jgi:hypothetical protein